MKPFFFKLTAVLTLLLSTFPLLRSQAFTRDKDFYIDLNIGRSNTIYGMFQKEDIFYLYGSMTSTENVNHTSAFRFFTDGKRDYSYKWYFTAHPCSKLVVLENNFIKAQSPTWPILFGKNGESPYTFEEGLITQHNFSMDVVRNTHTYMLMNEGLRWSLGTILPDGTFINTMKHNRPFWDSDGNIDYNDTAKSISLYKILPDGSFDSVMFQHKINKGMPFESALLEWGVTTLNNEDLYITGYFENYDGYPIKNLLRINTDGVLDTTFKSILTDGVAVPMHELDDGRILVAWNFGFVLEDFPNDTFSFARIHRDGSLDTSFRMIKVGPNPIDNMLFGVCPTHDGGYIVYGWFTEFDGYPRHNIAKINYDGSVDEYAFADADFGNSFFAIPNNPNTLESIPMVHNVQRSLDGQYYYVMGDFIEYNGEPVPKIIRFKSETYSTKEEQKLAFSLFPNPTADFIHLQLENTENVSYRITDITGKILAQNRWDGQAISVENLHSGVYFITLSRKNELLGTQKLIIR